MARPIHSRDVIYHHHTNTYPPTTTHTNPHHNNPYPHYPNYHHQQLQQQQQQQSYHLPSYQQHRRQEVSTYHKPRSTSYQTPPSSSSTSQTRLPSLTLQRPSLTDSSSSHILPPILRPDIDHKPVINNRQDYHSSTSRHPPPHISNSSTYSYGLTPVTNKYGSIRRSKSPLSSKYTNRIVSPTSRASDLAKYAMTKDEKPIIDSDGVARHRSNSRSSHTSTSVSPINERRPSLPSLSPSNHNLLTIDVELSKKRKERDGEDGTPGTPLSATSNSSFLMTPQFGPTEPSNQKRRLSLIESLASKEDDNNELKSLASVLKGESEDPFPWYKNTYDLSNFPIPQQEPITVFPIQFASYQVPNTNNNNTPQQQGNETPTTLAGATSGQQNNVTTNNGNNVSTDPNLSSMRTGAAPNSTGNNQSQSQNQDPNNMIDPSLHTPEIRFPDAETLASATASPSRGTGDVGNLNLGDASTQAALAAVSSNTNTPVLTPEHAAALLQPPSNQIDQTNIKKDQPFSRSPELRVSHKLAERKRRKEMKELFDELRDELPSDRGMKASKWEILSKAIDHVRQLKTSQDQMLREIEHLRREVDIARGGTGAYTHAYATTYNIPTTTYPPQNNFTNPSNNAANSTNNQQQQQQQQQQAVQNVQAQSQQQQAQPQSQVQQPQQQQIQQQPQQQQLQQPQQQNVQQNQDQTQQQQQQPQTVGQVESMQIDSKPTQ